MRLAALYSGGKDSTYSIYAAQQMGHSIECLVCIVPYSDQSHLLHLPDTHVLKLQAKSMNLSLLVAQAKKTDTPHETDLMYDLLIQAKKEFDIQGIVHGGILSNYQKTNFEHSAKRANLQIIAPLWGTSQTDYMHKLLDDHFDFILTSVTSDGLDDSWLGRTITPQDLQNLEKLSKRHSFNISFEGGEAETLVVNCPLFSKSISIKKAKKVWDGYRGRFEIQEVKLINHA